MHKYLKKTLIQYLVSCENSELLMTEIDVHFNKMHFKETILKQMNLPKITIVTPSYNQGEFIRETIESILNQNYPNLEYFIFDGGSSDESVDIIREYEDRITFWVSEPDKGQTDAINKGFRLATGDLCAWVNSDDILLPNCLSEIAKCYTQEAEPEIIHANCVYIDNLSNIAKAVRVPKQTLFFANRGVWSIPQPAAFYKTEAIKQVNYLNPEYHLSMDLDLWMKLVARKIKISHIPKYLGGFRWHESSKSTKSIELKKNKSDENPECLMILDRALPQVDQSQRRKWRLVLKIYQVLNLNYLRASYDTLGYKNNHWRKYF